MKNKIIPALFLIALIVTVSILAVTLNIEPAMSSTTNITISGHVYDDKGNPASQAYTFLASSLNGRGAANCYTDYAGFYSLTVPAGSYSFVTYVMNSALSYSQVDIPLYSDITKDVKLAVGNKVTGHIYDSAGHPVVGAQTNVYNATWLVPGVTTEGLGAYTIYIPNGSYTFALWPPADSKIMNFKNSSFTVSSDMTYNIVVDTGYIVSGNVQYPSGSKASGVSTHLVNSTGYTFSSGRYSDTMPTPGTYSIAAPAGKYTLQSTINSVIVYSEPNVVVKSDMTKDVTLLTVSISPDIGVADVGQIFPVTASVTGGSGIYAAYTWSVNGVAKATPSTPTFNFAPTETGAYLITAVAKDNQGAVSTQTTTATVIVNPALIPPQVSVSPSQIDQGQSSSFIANEASGGTRGYSYQWYNKAPSATSYTLISGATYQTYSFTTTGTTEVGKWSFILNATDSPSIPNTVSSTPMSVWVNPPPAVAVSPELAVLDEGSTKTFAAVTIGGSGAMTYEWFLDGSKVGANSTNYAYTAVQGTHALTVKVTDSANPALSATSTPAAITVNPALSTPTVSAINGTIDQGQPFKLNATAAVNGTAPYSYQWFTRDPNGDYVPVSGATSASCSIPTASNITAGVWYLVLHVTDSATTPTTVASNVITVTVNTAPSVSVSPASAAFTVGQSSTFTANPAGGSGVYTGYQWYVNGGAQQGQNSATFTFSPSSAGSYSVTATVTDSLGATSNMSTVAQVQTSPVPTPTPTPTQTPTPTAAPTATPKPTATPTPTPAATQNPTATPASTQPTPTQNVTQGPDTGTYVIISIALVVVVVVLLGFILASKKTSKNKKK